MLLERRVSPDMAEDTHRPRPREAGVRVSQDLNDRPRSRAHLNIRRLSKMIPAQRGSLINKRSTNKTDEGSGSPERLKVTVLNAETPPCPASPKARRALRHQIQKERACQ